MTTTTTDTTRTAATTAPTTPTPAALPDLRSTFAAAAVTGREVFGGIRSDQFELPTPCTDLDVRQMTGHVLAVLNRIAVLGGGGSFASTLQISDVADTELADAYDRYAAAIETVWSDDAVLGRIIEMPWGTMPAAILLGIYVNEITVHSWDLATATGQQPAWNDDVVATAYACIQTALSAEGRDGAPFDDVVPVADDAAMIDRLVAWNGRRP